jgi:hypothetical protein
MIPGLREAVEASWSQETSATPSLWSPENPARGQCAVTALIVQDWLGGDLIRGIINGESHYWNRIDTCEIVDWTLQQFVSPRLEGGGVRRERSYVLSFPATASRYEALKRAVEAARR